MKNYLIKVKQNWLEALHNKAFRIDLVVGLGVLCLLCVFNYYFFYYIEHLSSGIVLNDWVLSRLPAKDVSIPIVCFEGSVFVLLFIRSSIKPVIFITFLIGSLFIFITRDLTIGISQLRAPVGIIELRDPIGSIVYRSGFITRDLFYSGHVSFIFLIYLCVHDRMDKYYILFAVFFIGFLLLIQHVHYFTDVIAAPFFSFLCFWLAKKLLKLQGIKEP